jgi:hypothetical protein
VFCTHAPAALRFFLRALRGWPAARAWGRVFCCWEAPGNIRRSWVARTNPLPCMRKPTALHALLRFLHRPPPPHVCVLLDIQVSPAAKQCGPGPARHPRDPPCTPGEAGGSSFEDLLCVELETKSLCRPWAADLEFWCWVGLEFLNLEVVFTQHTCVAM